MTDVEEKTLNPKWSFSKRFFYKTRFLDKLGSKFFNVQCCAGGTSSVVGEAAMDLHTLSTGPDTYELTLYKGDKPAGVLKFRCVMKLVAEVTLMFTETNVTLTSGEGVQMDAFPSNRETAVLSFPFSAESIWVDMQTLTFEASLWDLLDPNSKEQMRFIVLNKDKVLLGEATVPFRENFSLDGNNVSYRTFIKKAGLVVGELSGVIKYMSLPRFAQMSGGKVTDNAVVVGGFLLYPQLPFPAYFEEEPPSLPLTQKADEDTKFSGSTAAVAAEPSAPPAAAPVEEQPPLGGTYSTELRRIPLPPRWEMRIEKLTGRPFFADHRVQQTCWEDPRFLPENWEQRIDPKSGRVYFAYHKTQQTSFIDPRYMPKDWEMRLGADGKPYFAHHTSRQTTFVDPRGLPPNVSPALDAKGRAFFLDHAGKTTSWEDPRKGQTPAVLARWRGEEHRRWLESQVDKALKELNEEATAERNEKRN